MKQVITFWFVCFFAGTNAQTITQSFNEPVVTDLDKKFRLDTSAYTTGMPLNVTGSNCTWDFSSFIATFPIVVDSFIAPAAAVGASLFPTSTFVQHRDLYTFYKSTANPSQTELLGGYTPSLTVTFTNSAIIATYPVSYGYSLNDPVSGSFRYNTTNGACNGNIEVTAAAVGTIKLANNVSVPNVICLKSVENLTLSVGIFPFGTSSQIIYNYYAPNKKFPIVNINYTVYKLIAGTPTITAFAYGSNEFFTGVGISESQLDNESYRVYPNPFSDHLSNRSTERGNVYRLYSASGQLLIETGSLEDQRLNALQAGIYFLESRNEKGYHHQKVLKE